MNIFGLNISISFKAIIDLIKRMRPGFVKFVKDHQKSIEALVKAAVERNPGAAVSELEGLVFETARPLVPSFVPDTQLKILILQIFDALKPRPENAPSE